MAEEDLITDFLQGGGRLPLEGNLAEISEISEARNILIEVWQFAPLEPGSSLREHVQQMGASAGPHVEARACALLRWIYAPSVCQAFGPAAYTGWIIDSRPGLSLIACGRCSTIVTDFARMQGTLKFTSQRLARELKHATLSDCSKASAAEWTNGAAFKQQWAVRGLIGFSCA